MEIKRLGSAQGEAQQERGQEDEQDQSKPVEPRACGAGHSLAEGGRQQIEEAIEHESCRFRAWKPRLSQAP